MNNSNKLQRKQTTQYKGRLVEVEVELRGKQGAQSNNLALEKRERENNVIDDTNNLLDRLIQQAIAQQLNKIYDPTFSESSYGFRPNKRLLENIQ